MSAAVGTLGERTSTATICGKITATAMAPIDVAAATPSTTSVRTSYIFTTAEDGRGEDRENRQ